METSTMVLYTKTVILLHGHKRCKVDGFLKPVAMVEHTGLGVVLSTKS